MKRLPNVISVLRVAGSIGLLICDVAGWMFWALYALCGISDMVDGPLARNLQAESRYQPWPSSNDSVFLIHGPTS